MANITKCTPVILQFCRKIEAPVCKAKSVNLDFHSRVKPNVFNFDCGFLTLPDTSNCSETSPDPSSSSETPQVVANIKAVDTVICTKIKANICVAALELLQLHIKVNSQYRLYLQTKEELKLRGDRTRLYTVHRSTRGHVRPRSRNLLLQAQRRAQERIKEFEAGNMLNKQANFSKPLKVKSEAAHSLLCQVVDRLYPEGKYVNSRPVDCPYRSPAACASPPAAWSPRRRTSLPPVRRNVDLGAAPPSRFNRPAMRGPSPQTLSSKNDTRFDCVLAPLNLDVDINFTFFDAEQEPKS